MNIDRTIDILNVKCTATNTYLLLCLLDEASL